jgi:hypothetical protein
VALSEPIRLFKKKASKEQIEQSIYKALLGYSFAGLEEMKFRNPLVGVKEMKFGPYLRLPYSIHDTLECLEPEFLKAWGERLRMLQARAPIFIDSVDEKAKTFKALEASITPAMVFTLGEHQQVAFVVESVYLNDDAVPRKPLAFAITFTHRFLARPFFFAVAAFAEIPKAPLRVSAAITCQTWSSFFQGIKRIHFPHLSAH